MIRRATKADVARIGELLHQVHAVHADTRPDIFVPGRRKYTDGQIAALIADDQKPVFVYEDETGTVQGYAFCIYQVTQGEPSLVDRKVLYLDDLCVDASQRGKGVGEQLYQHVLEEAKAAGCHSLTLHVWTDNEGAARFYQRLGLSPLKTLLEKRLQQN